LRHKAPHESSIKTMGLWSRELVSRSATWLRISPLVKLYASNLGDSFEIRIATRRKIGAASPITVRVELRNFDTPWRISSFDVFRVAPRMKFLQDLLGEIHDLCASHYQERKNLLMKRPRPWTTKLQSERDSRLQQYREKMAGDLTPLAWRAGFTGGGDCARPGLARLAEWAYFVTPSFPACAESQVCIALRDGFANCGYRK